MEKTIKNGEQFALLFEGFLKARDVLYGVNSSMFLDRSLQYEGYLCNFDAFLEQASMEDVKVIESSLNLSIEEIRKIIEKEFAVLKFEEREKTGYFDEN